MKEGCLAGVNCPREPQGRTPHSPAPVDGPDSCPAPSGHGSLRKHGRRGLRAGGTSPQPPARVPADRTRPDLLSEDVQRQFVQEVVQSQQAAVSRLLEDFRSKRLMGMTPWEHDLTQLEAWVGRDRASFEARERHLAERLLTHLEEMQ